MYDKRKLKNDATYEGINWDFLQKFSVPIFNLHVQTIMSKQQSKCIGFVRRLKKERERERERERE
jgi:hypothetical protein